MSLVSESLSRGDRATGPTVEEEVQSAEAKDMTSLAECVVCMRLLCEPVTTVCGHSYCRPCLQRIHDHAALARCPLCREALPRTQPRVNVILAAMLQKLYPAEYTARLEERRLEGGVDGAGNVADDSSREYQLPVFVLDVLLPGQKMLLNVFEPRYRLMVRRCLDGNRHFGMVAPDARSRMLQSGTPLTDAEITRCETQSDGRYLVEITGREKVECVDCDVLDGYLLVKVKKAPDNIVDAQQLTEMEPLIDEVCSLTTNWIQMVSSLGMERSPGQMVEIMRVLGSMPPKSEPARLSIWIASLINPLPVLGVAPEIRLAALRCNDTRQRLHICKTALERSIAYMESGSGQWLAPFTSVIRYVLLVAARLLALPLLFFHRVNRRRQ
mmetsp:Transcript_17317/g.56685  ORF Transcript_17317/g.56685 Transcript_17317/m.56685 type:complete len:384 (-) Transcript_17317:70-1221(-)